VTFRLFIVPTCRVHSNCALLGRRLFILFYLCPKFIVVKLLMCRRFWFFFRKCLSFIILRIFNSFLLGPRRTLIYVTVSGSFCMRLRDDDVFAECLSSLVIGHPSFFTCSYLAVLQIRGFARRMKIKNITEISRTF